jgi:hypothetical protein
MPGPWQVNERSMGGIPLRAGMVDVAGREHARAGRAELAALGVPG